VKLLAGVVSHSGGFAGGLAGKMQGGRRMDAGRMKKIFTRSKLAHWLAPAGGAP